MQNNTQSRQKRQADLNKALINFYKEPTISLVRYLKIEKKLTLSEIGKILNISKQAVEQQYLKEEN